MSSLIGMPGERWSLARAIDALSEAARQTGRPSLIWVLGWFFPTLTFTGGYGGEVLLGLLLSRPERVAEEETLVFSAGVLVALLFPRLTAGLARLGQPEQWAAARGQRRAPRLRDVWRASRGLGWSTLGLWLQVLLMLCVPALIVLAPPLYVLEHLGFSPATAEGESGFLCALLLGPFAAIVLALGFVLSVIYQLALQSLVHNRRGVASALLHAWRIARNDPWATGRAVVVDFLLYASALALTALLAAFLVFTCVGSPLAIVVGIGLPGFAGVARAAYWARVYRALGGLSPVDGVPGLEPGSDGSPQARPA